jgi:thiosulfate/3-mercaptopyruvate sulfurtransferase
MAWQSRTGNRERAIGFELPRTCIDQEKTMRSLVSTDWLQDHLDEADLVVVDSSWHMPSSARDGYEEYLEHHIPNARFLDIDELSDPSNAAPHMLPAASRFGKAMERLGVGRDDQIIVYDNSAIRTSARGWFMLRHFGARNVAILDGGFQRWIAEGRPTQSGEPAQREARFEAEERREVVTKEQLLAGIEVPLVDARGRARFEGAEADPRPGVAAGHIPGALNLPFSALYDENGHFRSREEIRQLFEKAGIDFEKPFVASCGSGVTANSLIFAAHLLGNDSTQLYDGSWSEWGADPSTPKVLGPS